MNIRPTNTSSRSTAIRLQRHKPALWLLLVLAAGLALFGLALVIPRSSMSADAAAPPTTADSQPSLQPGSGLPSNPSPGLRASIQPDTPQSSSLLLAGVVNGGFESGNLTNWSTGGSADNVEVLQVSDWTTSIGDVGRPAPTEGNYFVLLSSGPGAIGAAQGNIDLDGLATQDFDTSYLTTVLNPTASDVPATLSFDWSFLTAEEPTGQGIFDDFFRVRLNSVIILSGSRPYGGVSPFPDVGGMDNIQYTVNSTGPTNTCYFGYGRNSFQTFRMIINDPGSYTLEFLVADQGDANDDSGLLIDNVQLIPEIDLEITKTATPDPAIAGDPLVYHVNVTNYGSGRALDVEVEDTLPLEVEYIKDTLPVYADPNLPQGCTFSAGSGPGGADQLSCDLGDMLGGESVSFDIEVDVDADALANGTLALVNTAEVGSLTADGDLRNNTIILETILQDLADLRVLKVSKPDTSVEAGETFTYTIFVDNLGPSHARNVVLTDTILSSGAFTLLSVTPDPDRSDSCTTTPTSGGTVIACALNESLEPQGDPPRNGRWVIQVKVTANYAQDVDNVVDVFSIDPDGAAGPQTATPDPDTSNNRATDFIAVTDVADLKITKIGEDDANPGVADFSVRAGERVRWTIVVVNDGGPSTSENVAVVDILPAGLVEGSVSAIVSNGGLCNLGTPGDPNEPLICQLGNLAPTDTVTVTIRADVDPSYVVDQPNSPFANYLPNDAYLTSDTFDPEAQNNVVFDTLVEVTAEADLGVQKVDRPDYVIAGEQLEYTLTISNAGPSTAEDVVLLDELPDEVIALYVNVVNEPDATCSIRTTPANIIDCGFGNILPEKVITMVVTSLVQANTPAGTITNTATVSSLTPDPDPDPTPNQVQQETTVETEADLKIEKTSTPDKVYAGEQKKYTILVENLGPSDAQTVMVTDTLPISLTYEIDTDHCGVVGSTLDGAQVLECRYGRQVGPNFVFEPLPPGGTWQFDIWALVDPAIEMNPGIEPSIIITNTAVVTGPTTLPDPNEDNNTDTAKNLVLQKADLKITKFGKPDGQVRAGEILTYTIIVDNLGPSYAGIDDRDPVAGNVAIKDILQSDLEFDLLSITSDRDMVCLSIPTDADGPENGITGVNQHLEIDCTLLDALEVLSAGGPPNPGRWIITATVTATETQDINNVVRVTSDAFDPDLDNNQAEVMHEITDVSDLEITKAEVGEVQVDGQPGGTVTLKNNEVTAGRSLTYTLVITNYGPSTAENVVVEDRLPPWIVVTGFDTSQGDCDTGTPGEPLDKLTCGLGTLALDASATITITADVPSWVPEGTILENDALVYSDIWDPTNANNFATNLTTVSAWADLGITKSARGDNVTAYNEELQQFVKEQRDDEVTAGELLQYTLVVTNTGPSDAQNVVITDTLPPPAGPIATVHFVSADGATCRQDPIDRHELTCELGTMPVNEMRTVYILVRVDPSAAGPTNTADITNVATVSSDTNDPFDGPPPVGSGDNNTATNTTTVNAIADIFITKVDVPAEARLDETFEPDKAIAGLEHRYLITFGNDGPSVARDVVVTNTLDLKQTDILGEVLLRCEPVDPDDQVLCSASGIPVTKTVTVNSFLAGNEAIISSGTGTLNPGDSFSFYLITKVDPGYVLDADDTGTEPNLVAENTAFISSSTTDVRTQNNQDTEQTEIIAEADLEVTKTDTPDPGQNIYYDPVTDKFVYKYTITIENLGPSDAAKVVLTDTLPVDVTFQRFETLEDTQCYFRDDGIVFCLVGKDPNNEGTPQDGRLNVGSSKVVEIVVEVDASAAIGLENCVEVKAIAEAAFPFRPDDPIPPADFQDGRTPTSDPNLTNNSFCETTTLVTPEVKVDKKVYVRTSPARGIDRTTDGLTEAERCAAYATDDILTLPGDELTYCYTITNEGDTWLHSVTVRDAATTIVRTPTSDFEVAYPSQPPLRGTITVAGAGEAQTITIATTEPAKAVLAPKDVADDYDHILIVRSFTVDFPSGGATFLGTNTARVDAIPSTKYSTPLPGIEPSGDCEDPDIVCDTDLLHDNLALPVLEGTTKKWSIYEDRDGDGLPSPRDVIEYVVDIPNSGSGVIQATGVVFTDTLYNWINDNADDLKVPGLLINGSVSAAIHVRGRDPVTGRVIDADVQPPDLAFGEDLLLRTLAPTIGGSYLELTYPSAIVLDEEILKGNNPGDDEVHVATRLAIPPVGYLLRFGGVTYDPPIPVVFSLRIRYQVRLKDTKYVRLDTIVLSHGWLSYNEMGLFDQRFPDFDPTDVDAHTTANKVANYHAGTPGRDWESYTFPGWPEVPANVEPTNHLGLRFDDYGQLPGAPPRDNDDDPTWFKLEREPRRIQLPAIDHEEGEGTWKTQIKVQNGGDENTGAIVFFWGEYSGQCPYSDPGPVGSACKRVLENGVWSLEAQIIPSTAKSAIVYSVDEDLLDQACLAAAYAVNDAIPSVKWREWEDDYEGTGEPIAVIAQRQGPNEHDTVVASAYPGISENMEGGGPPYKYFAPYAMRWYHDLDTEMIIHNSGQRCTEVWLDYQKQGDCEFSYEERIVQLAPGESIRKRVPDVLGANWLGSIYVEADEPLGIVMDQTSFLPSDDQGGLLTYEARPYKLTTDTLFYADLIFRELSGWQASIQVQNLTQHSMPTFVTVEFFDASGDSILFLGEWVCRAGGATFYLPAIIDLGMQYAGAAVIQSHGQIDYPGGEHDGQPIFAVVDLKKTKVYDESPPPGWRPTMPGEIQGGAYNALAESDKQGASSIMLPFLTKGWDYQGVTLGVTSLIAVRNNSNCNQIELKLEVRKGSGTVVSYVHVFNLPPGHIKLIDLANVGSVNPGFVGAGTVKVTNVVQLCDTDGDGHKDMTPPMPSVVVVNEGVWPWDTTEVPGDITGVYAGIPFDYAGSSCLVTVSGQVIDELTLKPIEDVSIKVDTVEKDKTDFTGYYEFQVSSSTWGTAFTLDMAKTGYHAWSKDYTLFCDDLVINPELDPVCKTVTVSGTVEDKETGLPIPDAEVNAGNSRGAGTSTATDAEGNYTISDVPFDPDSVTIVTVSKAGYNPAADSVYIPACGGEANISFQLHQTPKSRILLYYGNGGEAPAPESGLNNTPHEYYNAEDMFEYFDYLVDYTANWPTDPDLEEYKVIFLLGPGNDSAPQDPASNDFTPGQIAQLDLFLRNGGRLVVMTDADDAVTVENNLIGALNDLDFSFDADTINNALADQIVIPTDQLMAGVATLDFDTATDIVVGPGVPAPGLLAELPATHGTDPGADMLAADTMPGITRLGDTGFAGDVVLIGDMDWMDDFSWMGTVTYNPLYIWPDWPADNENLLLNIITF